MRKSTALIGSLITLLIITVGTPTNHAAMEPTQEWVTRYDGPPKGSDSAVDIAVDTSGAVYITGSHLATGMDYDYDFAIVKYGADGTRLWTRRYDGPDSNWDTPAGLGLDGDGNVYVAGKSFALSTNYDFATLKYDSSGSELWKARYNSTEHERDSVTAMEVDSSGNVVVIGTSSFAYETISIVKYDLEGNQLWTYSYSAGESSENIPADVAVDASGNVYVTGYYDLNVAPWSYDLLILKLNADGEEQWVRTYNGTGDGMDGGTAIAVDALGNAYVTGWSRGTSPYYDDWDYVTIKYDTDGNQLWVARYDGKQDADKPNAIALDANGNVLVTGESKATSQYDRDIVTIKYDTSGNELWVNSYDDSSWNEGSNDIVADATGNIYVAGYTHDDCVTIKYDSSGAEQWVATYNSSGGGRDVASALAVDSDGNVYVTGYSAGDMATIKYNSSGTELWVDHYTGPSKDLAHALAVDLWGNAYVVGTSAGSNYRVFKYDTSGGTVWSDGGSGTANAVVVDHEGNVYITGTGYDPDNPYGSGDYATRKYDRNGTLIWTAYYDGPYQARDEATAIAIDVAGNVYVTGESGGSGANYPDYATVKYNSAGNLIWSARFNDPINDYDVAAGIAVDTSGNVYVTGYGYGTSNTHDYLTIKYDSSGVEQWVAWYDGPANSDDRAQALAVDDAGNVYVTGQSEAVGPGFPDYTTIKYDTSGNQLWVARYDGPDEGWDVATAIVLDPQSCLYVTGASGWTHHDFATVKYDTSGNELWVARYDGPDATWDGATAITIDVWGDVYVAGKSFGTGTDYDYAIVKYDTSGNELWVARYDGPAGDTDRPTGIGLDGLGNIYVTGDSDGGNSGYDWATIKYAAASLPEHTALDIAEHVWALVESGILNFGQGIALTVKLETAAQRLAAGKPRVATNNLNAFIHQIDDFVVTGVLAQEQASPLLEATQNLLIYIAGENE